MTMEKVTEKFFTFMMLVLCHPVAASQLSSSGPPNNGQCKAMEYSVATENCFWSAAVGYDPLWNFVYPDSNGVYSCASFNLPPGAKMRIDAEFPRARYTSWTVYGGSQTNQLVDVDIEANEGSVNPFRPGVNRNANDRSYSIDILQDDVPPKSEPNTLYTSGKGPILPPEYDPSGPTLGNVICLRIYVPDRGQYPFGGVDLPNVSVILEDNTVLCDKEMCQAINASNKGYGVTPTAIGFFNLSQYINARQVGIGPQCNELLTEDCTPPSWPARDPPVFRAFFNNDYQECIIFTNSTPQAIGTSECNPECNVQSDCDPGNDCVDQVCTPQYNPAGVGLGNPNNRYVETYFDQQFGDVFVLRAKLPTTPKTFNGEPFVDDYGNYDMRYFSICPQESQITWRVGKCLYDEEIPVDNDGYYTVAISRPSYRPNNANEKCGVAWTFSPAAGDGAGDLYLSNMWIQNELPSANFSNAAQNVLLPNQEEEVMGEYYPRGTYYSKEEFEAFGCPGICAINKNEKRCAKANGCEWKDGSCQVDLNKPQVSTLLSQSVEVDSSDPETSAKPQQSAANATKLSVLVGISVAAALNVFW